MRPTPILRRCAAIPRPAGRTKKQRSQPRAEKKTTSSSAHLLTATPGEYLFSAWRARPTQTSFGPCLRPVFRNFGRSINDGSSLHRDKFVRHAFEQKSLVRHHKNRLARVAHGLKQRDHGTRR